MDTKYTVSKEIIARDFVLAAHGKMDNDRIDAVVESLVSTTPAYYAKGNFQSIVFYLHCHIIIPSQNAMQFNGNAGGITGIGGGIIFGDVYTNDLDRLFSNTISFQYNILSVYTTLLFFDAYSNLLGHFQSGGFSTTGLGTGGGSGGWTSDNIPIPSPTVPATGNQMLPGQILMPGHSITSINGRYKLCYQADCNLVLSVDGTLYWSSGTLGRPAGVCIMQLDGNLVIRDSDGQPIWATNTWNFPDSYLVVQDDSNMVIYRSNGKALWATGSGGRVGG